MLRNFSREKIRHNTPTIQNFQAKNFQFPKKKQKKKTIPKKETDKR